MNYLLFIILNRTHNVHAVKKERKKTEACFYDSHVMTESWKFVKRKNKI